MPVEILKKPKPAVKITIATREHLTPFGVPPIKVKESEKVIPEGKTNKQPFGLDLSIGAPKRLQEAKGKDIVDFSQAVMGENSKTWLLTVDK